MINEVRNTVMFILNKDNNGYITPEAFNNYAREAQIDELEEMFHDYNRALAKMNDRMSGTGHGNIPQYLRESIDKFTEYAEELTYNNPGGGVTAHFLLPSAANGDTTEWFRIMNIQYNNAVDIERVETYQINNLNNSMMMAPSTDFPAYVHIADKIEVYPTTITANVNCSYIRYPQDPKWTYTVVSGDPVFNQGANDYQDFELPKAFMPKIIRRIAEYCGVHIREAEVVQYMNTEQATDKQLEQ